MVGNFTLSENRNIYGGYIFPSDFCTDYEGTRNIAERIASDWKFDRQCKKNIEARKRGMSEEQKAKLRAGLAAYSENNKR